MASKVCEELGTLMAGMAADKLFSLSGLFAVYKPKGPTSADLLNQLKAKLLAGTAGQGQGWDGVVWGEEAGLVRGGLPPCKGPAAHVEAVPSLALELLSGCLRAERAAGAAVVGPLSRAPGRGLGVQVFAPPARQQRASFPPSMLADC